MTPVSPDGRTPAAAVCPRRASVLPRQRPAWGTTLAALAILAAAAGGCAPSSDVPSGSNTGGTTGTVGATGGLTGAPASGGGGAMTGSGGGGVTSSSGGRTATSTGGGGGASSEGTGGRGSGDATGGAGASSAPSGGNTGSGTGGGGRAGAPGSGGAAAAQTGGRSGTAGTSGAGGGSVIGGPPSQPKFFNECRFHYGTLDSRARNNAAVKAQIDMFTPGWVGQSNTFDMGYVCTAIRPGGAMAGVTPAVVAYIIAFAARRDQGLQDCNVSGTTNLCRYGATYLRAHLEDRIIPLYGVYARGFAAACGATTPMIWLMEPDYYQYSTGGDANALTPAEAGQIMGRLVATVRQSLPNAVFSLDISPWIPNQGRDWYSHFNMNDFTFIHTSGGGTDADNTRIRAVNTMTWRGVHQVTGKRILADTGYGVAGSPTGYDPKWDVPANLNARIADGVIGITQYNPSASWATTITQTRPQLTAIPCQ